MSRYIMISLSPSFCYIYILKYVAREEGPATGSLRRPLVQSHVTREKASRSLSVTAKARGGHHLHLGSSCGDCAQPSQRPGLAPAGSS